MDSVAKPVAIAEPVRPSAGKPAWPKTSSQLASAPTPSASAVTTSTQPGRPSAAAAVRITPAATPGEQRDRNDIHEPARAARDLGVLPGEEQQATRRG